MIIITFIVGIIPIIAYLLYRTTSDPKFLYLSVLVLLPALFTTHHVLSCKITTLEEWYWLNCGMSTWEKAIALLTLPSVNIPLLSLLLSIMGIRKKLPYHFIFSSLLTLSLLGYWSIYFGLKYPMLGPKPQLPPLGYMVVRSNVGLLYLPLFILSLAFFFDYMLTRSKGSLKLGLIMTVIGLLPFFYWDLIGYGLPIPLTFYHLAIVLIPLTAITLIHYDHKVGGLGLVSSILTSLGAYRLYPLAFGGITPPFFALQTSIGLAIFLMFILALIKYVKAVKRSWSSNLGFNLLNVVATALLVLALAFLLLKILNVAVYSFEYYTALGLLVITAIALTLTALKYGPASIIAPISLVHPYLSLAGAALVALLPLKRERNVKVALMLMTSVLAAATLLYASSFSLILPYNNVTVSSYTFSKTKIEKVTYGQNVTALKYHYMFNIKSNKGNITMPLLVYVNVFANKYIPPNTLPFMSWSSYEIRGLEICALSARPFLGKPSADVFAYKFVCTPLGALAFVLPLLILGLCFVTRGRP